MDKREIQWNGIKITYAEGMNQFLVVPFVDRAIKCLREYGVLAIVLSVNVYKHVKFGDRMCCDITVTDGSMKTKHQYVDMRGDI